MPERAALLTGFEPYAGRGANPAQAIARALDGREIAGVPVKGRTLPVSHAELAKRVTGLLDEIEPIVVLSLGLWPGEPVVRIERGAANLADFEIPDNDGNRIRAAALIDGRAAARAATVPVREIEQALLAAGIPARLSASAGTFLCNACFYHFLEAGAARPNPPLTGFLHVPYLPGQVAELIAETGRSGRLELAQRADLASMELGLATRAVEIALAISIAAAGAG